METSTDNIDVESPNSLCLNTDRVNDTLTDEISEEGFGDFLKQRVSFPTSQQTPVVGPGSGPSSSKMLVLEGGQPKVLTQSHDDKSPQRNRKEERSIGLH